MKKTLPVIVVCLSIALFVAVNSTWAKTKLSLATATSAGVFYQNGIAIGELSRKGKIPGVEIHPQASSGGVANLNLLWEKEVHLAMVHNSTAIPAYEGMEEFKGKPLKNFKVITLVWKSVMHYPVLKTANINSIADYRGKRVQIGPIASGIEKFTLQPLSIYGIGVKDLKPMRLSVAECIQQMSDNQLDALVHASIVPDGNITQLSLTGKVKLIGMEPEKIEEMIKEFPMYVRDTIPANSYKNQDKELQTTSSVALLVAREDVDELSIYNLTKAIFDNHDFLVSMHSSFKDTVLKNALLGRGNIPIHPGAARYYREKGVLK